MVSTAPPSGYPGNRDAHAVPASPRLLNLSLTSDLVPEQDVIDVIIHVGRNPQGRNLAWRYFREKWEVLNAR